jgi:hypothetical protein
METQRSLNDTPIELSTLAPLQAQPTLEAGLFNKTLDDLILNPAALAEFPIDDEGSLDHFIRSQRWDQKYCEDLLYACASQTPELLPAHNIKAIVKSWETVEALQDWPRQQQLAKFVFATAHTCIKWSKARENEKLLLDYYDRACYNPFYNYFLTPLRTISKTLAWLVICTTIGTGMGVGLGHGLARSSTTITPEDGGFWGGAICGGSGIGTGLFLGGEHFQQELKLWGYRNYSAERVLAHHIQQTIRCPGETAATTTATVKRYRN